MTDRPKLGQWYQAHRSAQERALSAPMPATTRYRGERLTAARENDEQRYRDMINTQLDRAPGDD